MAGPTTDFALDIFAELPGMHGLYTQVSLFYGTPSSAGHVSSVLTAGLARLAAAFPWTAGHVVHLSTPDEWGRHYLIRHARGATPRLTVRDGGERSLAALRAAGYPFAMLGEAWLAPCATLAFDMAEKPVLLVQATVLADGVVVTVNAEHQIVDFVGQGAVMALLDKACRGESFTDQELELGNRVRRDMTPLLEEGVEVGPGLQYQMRPKGGVQNEPETAASETQPECEWAYFNVTAASLATLKEKASSQLQEGFVSTDDCLSALVWQSVLRARLPRLREGQETTLARAVDARRYVGVSKSYPGFLQNMVYATEPVSELVEAPLGRIAAILRSKVDPETCGLGMATRELATALHRASEKERESIGIIATLKMDIDLMLSSWAGVDCYGFEFGLGFGRPEQVKRPRLAEVESLAYLMPKTPNGDGAVGICLRKEDLQRLKQDKQWSSHVTHVG